MTAVHPLPGPIVIVGAGIAGVQAAMGLRSLGAAGEIVIVGEEPRAYDRPPLSKELLIDQAEPNGFDLLSEETARVQRLDFRRGVRVDAIDRTLRRVTLSDGTALDYARLILATGGAATSLPILPPDDQTVFVLRTEGDAKALSKAMQPGRKMLVVGAGWLGLETAVAGRARGLQVTLVELADRVCARSAPRAVSEHLEAMQRSLGVDVRLGRPCRLEKDAAGVRLSADGETDALFDLCVTAIGMKPRDELARQAGLDCEDGIVADAAGRTADPNIYTIGDTAAWWSPKLGRRLRLESWQGARVQALTVAADILGLEAAVEAPWFWSAQGDQLLQVAGLPSPDAQLIASEPGERPLWRYGHGDETSFVIGINRAKDLRMAHRELARAWRPATEEALT